MHEEGQSPIGAIKPTPTEFNLPQAYQIPTMRIAAYNRPGRWRSWVGIQCLAFCLGCMLCLGLMVGGIALFSYLNDSIINSPDLQLFYLGLIGILCGAVFITIYNISSVQAVFIKHAVKRVPWSFHSAIVGTLTFTFTAISSFALGANDSLSTGLVFGATSSAIGIIQAMKLRSSLDNAWHWALVTVLTWTTLGTLIIGVWLMRWLQPLNGS